MSRPANAESQIEISAEPGIVWDVITAIESWPNWNKDVRNAVLHGPLAEGTTFTWKAGPGTVTSRFARLERPTTIVWTGKTLGVTAEHTWRLQSIDGGTRVNTEESWVGLLVTLLRGTMTKALQKALDDGLKYLKIEAEGSVQS